MVGAGWQTRSPTCRCALEGETVGCTESLDSVGKMPNDLASVALQLDMEKHEVGDPVHQADCDEDREGRDIDDAVHELSRTLSEYESRASTSPIRGDRALG